MIKQFLKDSAWYSLGNVANKVLQICMVPFFARVLSPANYGVLEMLMVATTIVNTTIALEIHQAISRFFPELDDERRKQYMSTAILFSLAVYLIFFIFAMFFWRNLNLILFDNMVNYHVYILMLVSVVSSYSFSFLNNQLRWLLMAKENVLCNIVNSFFTLTTSFFLVIILKTGIIGMIIGMIIGNFLAISMTAFYGKKYISTSFSQEYLKIMLKFSYPAAISSICIIFGSFIDRIFIKEYMTLSDLGIYSMGYKIAGIVSVIISGIQGSLMPLVYRAYRDENTKRSMVVIFKWVIFLFLSLFLFVGIFSNNIVSLFLGSQFAGAGLIAPLMILAVTMSNLYIFAPGIHIAKKTKIITAINIIVTLISICLNFMLIPRFGLEGAAVANVIRAGIFCFLFFYISFKFYPLHYEWGRISIGLVAALFIYAFTIIYLRQSMFYIQIIEYVVSMIVLLLIFMTQQEVTMLRNIKAKYFS